MDAVRGSDGEVDEGATAAERSGEKLMGCYQSGFVNDNARE